MCLSVELKEDLNCIVFNVQANAPLVSMVSVIKEKNLEVEFNIKLTYDLYKASLQWRTQSV